MPSLPAVFVELRANASQFTAAMKSAQDEIKKTADTSQSNSDRMAQVGKVAFAGLAAAAVGFGAVAVKAALEGEQAHAQLVQAVQNSGTAFSSVGGQVDDMSGRFAKLGFENDAVEAALARLVQSTGNVSGSMREMGLVADFARARHVDLEQAATIVGKVMNGNVTALQRMGIATKDAAGNTLTAAQALQMLSDRFGGAAQANAGTYAGRLQALNAEWHNMVESVGNMLLPVLGDMAGALADVAGWFEKHQEVAAGLAGVIAGPLVGAMTIYIAKQAMAFGESVAGLIGNVAKAVFGLVPAIEAAEGAEAGLASTTILATGGLSVLGGLAGLAIAHFMGQSSATNDVAEASGNATSALDAMSGAEEGVTASATAASKAAKDQADTFKQLNNDTDAQSSMILKLIGDQQNLSRASLTLAGHTKDVAQAQKDAKAAADNLGTAQKKLNDATDAYNKLQAGVGQAISKDHVSLQHNLTQAQLNNEEAQRKVTDAVTEYGVNSFEARQANLDLESSYIDLQGAQEAMGHEGEAAWKAVDDAQQKVVDAKQAVQDALDKQLEAVTKLKQPAADLATNTLAWQQAQGQLNKDMQTFQDALVAHPELRDQLAGQIERMKAGLPKGADVKPLNDLLDKINAMDKAKLAAVDVALILAQTSKDVGNILAPFGAAARPGAATPSGGPSLESILTGGLSIPGAAEGAVVKARPGGRLMIVGEGGSDEAIVPLDRAGAGGGVVINVYGNGRTDQELATVIREELLKAGRNLVGIGLGG